MKRPIRHVRDLQLGDAGVLQTLADMRRLARRDARSPAVQGLVKNLRRRSDWETARACFDHVVKTIRYMPDPPGEEKVTAPIWTLFHHRYQAGDCDDQSTALASLYQAVGLRSWFVTLAWRRVEYTHVYVVVELPSLGIAVPADPVYGVNGFGVENPFEIRKQFYPVF